MNPFVIAFRRIIYSIPLKRLLVGLAVFSVLFACISSADYVGYMSRSSTSLSLNVPATISYNSSYCIYKNTPTATVIRSYSGDSGNTHPVGNVSSADCFSSGTVLEVVNTSNNSTTLYAFTFSNVSFSDFCGCPSQYTKSECKSVYDLIDDSECVGYDSLQCQTEFDLIPINSVDQNYCTTNNLCPVEECPDVPVYTGDISQLYINNILHIGAPNIIMNIPEEIDWDYAYTMGGNTMNIDIVGYNQDYEKIEDWIYTNNYKPSSDDFTNIFTNFSNFGGLLVATLFIILVFYFVKKMFK